MQVRHFFLVAVLAIGAIGCSRPDGLYCEDSTDCTDQNRSFCDLGGTFAASGGVGNTCIADPNVIGELDAGVDASPGPDATMDCVRSEDCSDVMPICNNSICEDCTFGEAGDTACANRDSSEPFCTPAGGCAECLENSGCGPASPICTAGSCTVCTEHSQCDSGACDTSGRCVLVDDIVYVDTQGNNGATCGGPTGKCRTLSGVLGALIKLNGKTHVVMTLGTYNESISLATVTATLVGNGATLSGTGDVVSLSFGADIVLHDMIVSGGTSTLFVDGVGILCGNSDLRLENVQVRGSAASGIDSNACNLRIEESAIHSHVGEGIKINGGSLTILDSVVEGNGNRGIRATNTVLQIERIRVVDNRLGGLNIKDSTFQIESSEFVDNGNTVISDDDRTGGIVIQNDVAVTQTIRHCTIAGNEAPNPGGAILGSAGIECGNSLSPVIVNSSIIVDNTLSDGPNNQANNCTVSYSDIVDVGGAGNITAPPNFVDADNGLYHLMPGSPGLNVADPASPTTTDIDGQDRPAGAKDMGADEV